MLEELQIKNDTLTSVKLNILYLQNKINKHKSYEVNLQEMNKKLVDKKSQKPFMDDIEIFM